MISSSSSSSSSITSNTGSSVPLQSVPLWWAAIEEIAVKALTDPQTTLHSISASHTHMYRLVYEAASHSPQLLTDLLVHRLADSQFDGLRARLERGEMMQATTSSGGRGQGDHHHHIGLMNTSRYWLDHCLLPVLQQALRSISILSTLFGYLDRSFIIPTHKQTLHFILSNRFKHLLVLPLNTKLFQLFHCHITRSPHDFQESSVKGVVDALLELDRDYIYLNPTLFQFLHPSRIPSQSHLAKYAQLLKSHERIGIDLFASNSSCCSSSFNTNCSTSSLSSLLQSSMDMMDSSHQRAAHPHPRPNKRADSGFSESDLEHQTTTTTNSYKRTCL